MQSFKITALFLIGAIAFGCNKKLDVKPQNSVTPDQITTSQDVKAVLFGAYSTMQNANSFGEKFNTTSELLYNDDDLTWVGTFAQYDDLNRKQQTTQNSTVYQIWANAYQTIAAVNLVLSKIDLIEEAERAAIDGEAKFIRGLIYFQLINLYAKPYSFGNVGSNPGVPLVLEPIAGYDPVRDKRPRASVEAVYTQIVADLTTAVAGLPEEAENERATKFAAEAILSRVYLSQANYSGAAEMANDVIENSGLTLSGTYAAAFNNIARSSEDIFTIQQTSQSNSGTTDFGITTFYATNPIGRGDIQVTEEHVGKYEADDARGQFVYEGESITGAVGLLTGKFKDLYKAITVVRLSEMYLTRAEGNYRSGTTLGATPLADVNMIRARSGATPLGSISSVDQIVNERILELAFEGEKFLTMKRLKMDVGNTPFDDPFLVLPIPQREIDLGNALPQNDGY